MSKFNYQNIKMCSHRRGRGGLVKILFLFLLTIEWPLIFHFGIHPSLSRSNVNLYDDGKIYYRKLFIKFNL